MTGHSNLSEMAFDLPADHPWRERLNGLDKHSPAATRYRYPTATGRLIAPPSAEQLRWDMDELTQLLAEARRMLR